MRPGPFTAIAWNLEFNHPDVLGGFKKCKTQPPGKVRPRKSSQPWHPIKLQVKIVHGISRNTEICPNDDHYFYQINNGDSDDNYQASAQSWVSGPRSSSNAEPFSIPDSPRRYGHTSSHWVMACHGGSCL